MSDYLLAAKANLIAGNHEDAQRYLSLALGIAKRTGQGYAAGRILTAIQWAKRAAQQAS